MLLLSDSSVFLGCRGLLLGGVRALGIEAFAPGGFKSFPALTLGTCPGEAHGGRLSIPGAPLNQNLPAQPLVEAPKPRTSGFLLLLWETVLRV